MSSQEGNRNNLYTFDDFLFVRNHLGETTSIQEELKRLAHKED